MKGISTHSQLMKGGIFKTANFDPFRRMGVASSFNAGTRYGNATVTKTIRYIEGYTDSSTPSLLEYADNGTNTSALYKTAFAGTTTDISAAISTATTLARGCKIWYGTFIYAKNTDIRYYDNLAFTGGSDASIITSGIVSAEHPFTIGADLNLYFPNGNSVGRIVNTTPASTPTFVGTASVFALESEMIIRQVINDGRYLVILADNNTQNTTTGANFRCCVAFWDMTSPNLAQRYDFIGTGIIGGGQLDDGTYIIARDFLYVCNVATRPSAISPFTGSANVTVRPLGVGAIAVRGNQLIWGNATFMGYGNLTSGDKKIFFVPANNSAANITAIAIQQNTIWAGSDTPDLYAYDNAGAAQSTSFSLSQITFDKPYTFDYAKVVTYQALSSGQSFSFSSSTLNGTYQVTQSDDKTFTADGVRTSLIFKRKNTVGNAFAQNFEELDNITVTMNGPIVKFEIWATPIENQESKLLT
jgi:hypothetical protein